MKPSDNFHDNLYRDLSIKENAIKQAIAYLRMKGMAADKRIKRAIRILEDAK